MLPDFSNETKVIVQFIVINYNIKKIRKTLLQIINKMVFFQASELSIPAA